MKQQHTPILMYLMLTLFVGLKLTGDITWSWFWVLAPLWMPIVLIIGILLLMVSLGGRVKRTK